MFRLFQRLNYSIWCEFQIDYNILLHSDYPHIKSIRSRMKETENVIRQIYAILSSDL